MKTVVVTVSGGVADVVEIPKGVKVIIRDYDVEGGTAHPTKTDKNGDKYVEGIYEAD